MDTMKVCSCHEEQVPLIWTFKFDGKEYWCPACGYTSGMFGAGENVPQTPELLASLKEWTEKALPYLRDEVDEWAYIVTDDQDGKLEPEENLPATQAPADEDVGDSSSESTSKPLTWNEIKAFIESIPEDQRDEHAILLNPDESPQYLTAYFQPPVYFNKFDKEECYFKEDFEIESKTGYIENPQDFELDEKERPFLSTEL